LVITHQSEDGSICRDDFGSSAATVACRELGFPVWLDYGANSRSQYGDTSGLPILVVGYCCVFGYSLCLNIVIIGSLLDWIFVVAGFNRLSRIRVDH
jgi:hypothetical protein